MGSPSFHLYSNGKRVTDKIPLSEFSEEETGIFESLRTYGGKIFHLEEHLDRLFESAKTAGFSASSKKAGREQSYFLRTGPIKNNFVPSPLDRKRLRREVELALRAFKREVPREKKDLFIRLTLFQKKIFVMLGTRVHAPGLYRRGVALKTSPVKRSLSNASFPEVKTSSYQNAVLASLEPSGAGTYEWLFLDRNGFATEVRIGNFFMVKEKVLYTPPVLGILNGVTRRFVIKCSFALHFTVKEVPLTRHEIYNADEAFLTNTSWEIPPPRDLDPRRRGRKIPGPMTLKL